MPKDKRLPNYRTRSDEALGRTSSQRKPGKSILIVCEGEKTEPRYFLALKKELKLISVEVEKCKGGAAISIVERALYLQNKGSSRKDISEFDEVWCMFDTEHLANTKPFKDAIDKAEKNKLSLAISNPAFEYWYLLHFRETNKPFADASELENELKGSDCIPNYKKNSHEIFNLTYKHIEIALERAERLHITHPDYLTERFPNPCTTVYELIKKLREMSR